MSRREQPMARQALTLLLLVGLALAACAPADGPGGGGDAAPAATGGGAPADAVISAEDFETGDTGIFRPEEPSAAGTGPTSDDPTDAAAGESDG